MDLNVHQGHINIGVCFTIINITENKDPFKDT